MTTEDAKKNEKSPARGTKEITFQCKSCGKYKKLSEMRVLTRFFPLLVTCQDCEEEMR